MTRSHLNSGDVRELLRLSGEVRELGGDPDAWRPHLLDRLGGLCGGAFGVAFEHWAPRGVTLEQIGRDWDSFTPADGPPAPSEHVILNAHAVDRGLDERDRAFYYHHVYEAERAGDPAFATVRERAQREPAFSASSVELVGRRAWDRAPFIQEKMRACGMGHYVMSMHFAHPIRCALGLYVFRPWGERPFGARELELVDLVHSELSHSFTQGPAVAVESLPPRLRQTLTLLLEGKREKEVAAELDLSPATVHTYVKALYRRFGVTGRAELSSRLLEFERRAGPRLKGAPPGPPPGAY